MKKLSFESVNNKISEHGIAMVGDYRGSLIRTEFKCEFDHRWYTTPHSVLNSGSRCPECTVDKSRQSSSDINNKIFDRGLEMTGNYINNRTRTEFRCKCGHVWLAAPINVVRGTGCPKCCKYGFDRNLPGWIYILQFDSYVKYGITNNLTNRLKGHSKSNGRFDLKASKLYDNGQLAWDWEQSVKSTFGGRFVTKKICPDGWTETLPIDVLLTLLDTIQ
jgi:hypothetical protein